MTRKPLIDLGCGHAPTTLRRCFHCNPKKDYPQSKPGSSPVSPEKKAARIEKRLPEFVSRIEFKNRAKLAAERATEQAKAVWPKKIHGIPVSYTGQYRRVSGKVFAEFVWMQGPRAGTTAFTLAREPHKRKDA